MPPLLKAKRSGIRQAFPVHRDVEWALLPVHAESLTGGKMPPLLNPTMFSDCDTALLAR